MGMESVSGKGCICTGLSHGLHRLWGCGWSCPLCEDVVVQLSICHVLGASCSRGGDAPFPVPLRKSADCSQIWCPLSDVNSRADPLLGPLLLTFAAGGPVFFLLLTMDEDVGQQEDTKEQGHRDPNKNINMLC